MKRKLLHLALIAALIVSMLFVCGCGDPSDLAGSASVSGSGQSQETAEDKDAGKKKETKYDATEFLASIPEWDGQPYCEVNGNKPDLKKNEIWKTTQESLAPLDDLGRCGTANSCIGVDGMPDQPRGDISEIHPTGWHSDTYDSVEGGNLYNRCHLIAYKLSGDDAIDRNLITGTSYMNRKGMLPFEDLIEVYVEKTGNHVMYRVEPCFKGDELLARGVHMQAVSVEDGGEGLSFNVFCYNVQPGIDIDYATGDNKASGEEAADDDQTADDRVVTVVLNTNPDRKRIHLKDTHCAGQIHPENYQEWTGTADELKDYAEKEGYVPCGSCHPDTYYGIDLP